MIHPTLYALLTTCTRYVFDNDSGVGDVTIAPGYHSGVAVVARQRAARRQAAEAAARQAAADVAAEQATAEAEASAQQGASPDPQSPLHAVKVLHLNV